MSMRISYEHHCIHSNWYNFCSFLALNSTHIISDVPNLISTFVSNSSNHISEFPWLAMWLKHVLYMWVWEFSHAHAFTAIVTHFHRFLVLNSSHIISEVPKSDQCLCSCVYIHNLEWCKQLVDMVLVTSVRMSILCVLHVLYTHLVAFLIYICTPHTF